MYNLLFTERYYTITLRQGIPDLYACHCTQKGVIMNADTELLNYIYQNSEMGMETLPQLIEITENEGLKSHLQKQLTVYKDINEDAKLMLSKNGYDEKSIGSFQKITSYIMTNVKTLTDRSSSNIAKIVINGSNMGIIDATENINKYEKCADSSILSLIKKLLKIEEKNIEELKAYL